MSGLLELDGWTDWFTGKSSDASTAPPGTPDYTDDTEYAKEAARAVKEAAASAPMTKSEGWFFDSNVKTMEKPKFWENMTPQDATKYGTVLGPLLKIGLDLFKKKKKQKKKPAKAAPFVPSGMSGTMKGLLIIGGLGAAGLLLYGMKRPKGAAASTKASPQRRSLMRRYYRRPRAYLRRVARRYTRRK